MVTAKHKLKKFVFNQANQKFVEFLDELRQLAGEAFGIAAHVIIEQFIYDKMPPHLKKSMLHAHLENGTNEQLLTELENEQKSSGLEAPDERQVNTVSQNATKQTSHHLKKLHITEISAVS